jgi:hypothetical protein
MVQQVRGVYFLANDAILDVTIAFLNSFRLANPTIPLCLIPFDGSTAKIEALSELYSFLVFDDSSQLELCDRISRAFFPQNRGHFRKLAAFEGPFDEFLYIDCDTVVVKDISFVFQFLRYFDFIFSHSDTPGLIRWVWKRSILGGHLLSARQTNFSANTGFFCSKRGVLNLEALEQDLPSAERFKPHMELGCMEQPYLNYAVVTSGKRFTSLLKLKQASGQWDLPLEKWAGPGLFKWQKDSVCHDGRNFMLYHWAGSWAAGPFDKAIYAVARAVGLEVRSPSVRLFMSRKRLWNKYRYYPYCDKTSVLTDGRDTTID